MPATMNPAVVSFKSNLMHIANHYREHVNFYADYARTEC